MFEVLSGFLIGFLIYYINFSRKKFKAYRERAAQNLLNDLELATSSQLIEELRKRPNFPYLLLFPVSEKTHSGLSIEVHNIPPVQCLELLYNATTLTFGELKNRGIISNQFNIDEFNQTEEEL